MANFKIGDRVEVSPDSKDYKSQRKNPRGQVRTGTITKSGRDFNCDWVVKFDDGDELLYNNEDLILAGGGMPHKKKRRGTTSAWTADDIKSVYLPGQVLIPIDRDDNVWLKIRGELENLDSPDPRAIIFPVVDKAGRERLIPWSDISGNYELLKKQLRDKIDFLDPDTSLQKKRMLLKLGLEKKFSPVFVELGWDEGVLKIYLDFTEMPDREKLLVTLNKLSIQELKPAGETPDMLMGDMKVYELVYSVEETAVAESKRFVKGLLLEENTPKFPVGSVVIRNPDGRYPENRYGETHGIVQIVHVSINGKNKYEVKWLNDRDEKVSEGDVYNDSDLLFLETPEERKARIELKKEEERKRKEIELLAHLKKIIIGDRLIPLDRNDSVWYEIIGEPTVQRNSIRIPVKDKFGKKSKMSYSLIQDFYFSIESPEISGKLNLLNPEQMPLSKKATIIKMGLERKGLKPQYVELEWEEGILKLYLTFIEMPDEDTVREILKNMNVERLDRRDMYAIKLIGKTSNQLIYQIVGTVEESLIKPLLKSQPIRNVLIK